MSLIVGTAAPAGPVKPDLSDLTINPHGLTSEDLDEYPANFWPLVLKYGRTKFGLASLVIAVNGAMNHLGDIGRRHNCQRSMQAPMDALTGSFVNLFDEICKTYKWTADEIKVVQTEIMASYIKEPPTPKILTADGRGTLN